MGEKGRRWKRKGRTLWNGGLTFAMAIPRLRMGLKVPLVTTPTDTNNLSLHGNDSSICKSNHTDLLLSDGIVDGSMLASRRAIDKETNATLREITDLARELSEDHLIANETALLLPRSSKNYKMIQK